MEFIKKVGGKVADRHNKFQATLNRGQNVEIEKNSTLIVCVKCTQISALSNLQQQILLFEEDEYFFKKYVVLYTESALTELISTPLIPKLREIVSKNQSLDAFAQHGFNDANQVYVVVLQLFIKLSFLTLDDANIDFHSLREKMISTLGNEITNFNYLLENSQNLLALDFSKDDAEESINEALTALSND